MRIVFFLIKCVMIIAIIVGVASYLNYLRTGQFWLPNFSMSSITSSMPSFDSAPTMQTLEPPSDKVYKWRVNGEWVYGDTPPAGVAAQRVGEVDN